MKSVSQIPDEDKENSNEKKKKKDYDKLLAKANMNMMSALGLSNDDPRLKMSISTKHS